jgi:polyhydroxyalkanoate synthase subunit PhaC
MTEPHLPGRTAHEDPSDQAARHTLALNPLVSLRPDDLVHGVNAVLSAILTDPAVAARQWQSFVGELGEVLLGKSERVPEKGDKRFADKSWKSSSVHQGLMQSYLALGNAIGGFVESSNLSDVDKIRAQIVTSIFIDALAPTNGLLTNPAALRQVIDTGGRSLLEGVQNFMGDLAQNGGLPSQVDRSAFKVGQDLANTPGAVVFKNELVELIQYSPVTEKVRQRPLLIVPPQINKYYAVDLTPEKSLVRFLLSSEIQTFCISWRNPTPGEREWGLDTYVDALDEAVDAVRQITGVDDITIMGSCSGGITASAYAAVLASRKRTKIRNLVLAVCVLDCGSVADTTVGALMTPTTIAAAKKASQIRGVLDGQDLARMFAWMRPNDLIWNYWVNNYLMGNQPPAFDILFWNSDTTRLPARLHADYLDFYFSNPFVNPGKLSLNGSAVDMGSVEVDGYVIAGLTDHITPWKSVYQTAKILGEDTTFILSNSGHLQSLLNPPTNSKASFVTGSIEKKSVDEFLADGTKQTGSWWLHWREWLEKRSGEEVVAQPCLGSTVHPAGEPAPGSYVFEK